MKTTFSREDLNTELLLDALDGIHTAQSLIVRFQASQPNADLASQTCGTRSEQLQAAHVFLANAASALQCACSHGVVAKLREEGR